MINIKKSSTIPSKLLTDGKTENENNCVDYDKNRTAYNNGELKFDIKNKIYGHTSVKTALRGEQDKKCCFCEKDQSDEYGVVEHFRPKGGYKSSKNQNKLNRPGYYWLGYEWKNLYFVCSRCNSSAYKGNLFPLADESKRAKSHHDDIRSETPLLIDPAGRKDPRKHIIFENQFPGGRTKYGKKTIRICGLDREALNDKRKELIDDIDFRIAILDQKSEFEKGEVIKARQFIRDSVKATAEFSATAMDYLKTFSIQF